MVVVVLPAEAIGIDGDDDVDGVDHAGDVAEDGEHQADQKLKLQSWRAKRSLGLG